MELFVDKGGEDEPPAGRGIALRWDFLVVFVTFLLHLSQVSPAHHPGPAAPLGGATCVTGDSEPPLWGQSAAAARPPRPRRWLVRAVETPWPRHGDAGLLPGPGVVSPVRPPVRVLSAVLWEGTCNHGPLQGSRVACPAASAVGPHGKPWGKAAVR